MLCGGEIPADPALANGSFFQPTIIEGLSNSARACQEEIFGPVLVAMSFADEATLIREANDSVYGGGGDLDARYRARPASQRAAGGRHGVDQHLQSLCDFDPVRGFKERSGPREGYSGAESPMQQKSIYLATGNSVNHWCD